MDSRPPSKCFSIIIPTRNRPAQLDRCLESLAALNYPKTDFEVLVVDDGSDPPLQIANQRFGGLSLHSLRCEGLGPARARNAALRQAIGTYVVFTDDDCVAEPDWLLAFADAFEAAPEAAFGGRILDHPDNAIYGRVSQLLVTFFYEEVNTSLHGLPFFCANNIAMPQEPLLQLNGFDESFPLAAAEDRDLCARWLERWEMHYLPTAVVLHRQALNFRSFWSQQYRYGRGSYQFWLRRGDAQLQHRIAPLSFFRMLKYPFSQARVFTALKMTALLGISQLAIMMGFVAERRKALLIPDRTAIR